MLVVYARVLDRLLEHGVASQGQHLRRKLNLLQQPLSIDSQTGMKIVAGILSGYILFRLCMQSWPFWVRVCNSPTCSINSFTVHVHCFWLLQSVRPLFLEKPWIWGGKGVIHWPGIVLWTSHHLLQKETLKWQLRDALIWV